ncbi:MAG: histidinol dehydrogenase [Chitinophagaceae bacterium]
MELIEYPAREDWSSLLKRPSIDSSSLEKKVRKILENVKDKGDKAVRKYSKEFDGIKLKNFQVSEKEIQKAIATVPEQLKAAIQLAKNNIEYFHSGQLQKEELVETMPGVQCWRKSVAIDKVGLYIPGGTAPLFSTILMLGIPATLAGCREIILCSPPSKDGSLNPAILFAANLVGVTKIYKIGGVQAIAAMAFGTETIPAVYKIFGPGNQYVTCAKQLVQQYGIAIDMPAGPSEVAVYADEKANAAFVAADLLSQAEHGIDSQVLLVTTSATVEKNVQEQLSLQLEKLPRKELAAKALENSKVILLKDENEAIDLLNEYAPEHLILSCNNADELGNKVINAGSVFIGHYSPESVGDYASGTNHTLPTNGYAKAYSGVSVDSFVKKITFQKLSEEGLKNIGHAVITMAEAEGLEAHANAVRVRMGEERI